VFGADSALVAIEEPPHPEAALARTRTQIRKGWRIGRPDNLAE
jgi:hypothetical protein